MTIVSRLRAGTWNHEHGLTAFLAVLATLLFVISPLVECGVLGAQSIAIVFAVLLTIGAVGTARGRRARLVIVAAVVVAIVLNAVTVMEPSRATRTARDAINLTLLGTFASTIAIEIVREGRMTLHRLFGAVSLYLLIAAMCGMAYGIVHLNAPGAFTFTTPPGDADATHARLGYFSFVTLTTLGYGDVIPVHPAARAIAVVEALIGQLYPTMLIGGLVSRIIIRRTSAQEEPARGESS